MCNLINTHTHRHIPPWEDQCEWHKMTRMTGPDCAVMCNFINAYPNTIHEIQRAENGADASLGQCWDTRCKVQKRDRAHTPQVTYLSNVGPSCGSVGRRPGALSVQALNVDQHRSDHLARNHPGSNSAPFAVPNLSTVYILALPM